MGGLLHLIQRGGPGRAAAPPSPLLAVPNVTAHPLTVSVPSSYYLMWHYNSLCPERVNVRTKQLVSQYGANKTQIRHQHVQTHQSA